MAKTGAERARAYRERKRAQRLNIVKKPPKSGAQRIRELRARQKALKSRAHNLESSSEANANTSNNHYTNELIKNQNLPDLVLLKVKDDTSSTLKDPLSVKLVPEIDIHCDNMVFIKTEPTDNDISVSTINIPIIKKDEIKTESSSNSNDVSAAEIVGNRVVDIRYFFKEVTRVLNHSMDAQCRKGLVITEERRNELMSTIILQCRNCWKIFLMDTHPNDKINAQFFAGIKSDNLGYKESTGLLAHLKVPGFSEDIFQSLE